MKKVLFSVLIALVLLWNCGAVFAQGKGEGRGARREDKQTKKVQKKGRGRQTDAYKRSEQKQLKMRRKDRLKMREMRRKGKERFKGGKDITQQFETVQKQIAHEMEKHLRRLARMIRIQELALEEGNKDIIKRVDMLRQKEQRRYEHKCEILRMRTRKLMRGRERKVRPPHTSRKEWRDIKKRPYGRKVKGESKGSGEKNEQ